MVIPEPTPTTYLQLDRIEIVLRHGIPRPSIVFGIMPSFLPANEMQEYPSLDAKSTNSLNKDYYLRYASLIMQSLLQLKQR